MPSSIDVIKTGGDGSDDWVEIQFGDVDPAIAPLKYRLPEVAIAKKIVASVR